MQVMKAWWISANLQPPFTPGFLTGGNDGNVYDAKGDKVADCGGNEARADVVAAALNYTVTRQDDQIRLLAANLLCELGYGTDPRLGVIPIDQKKHGVYGDLKKAMAFTAPPPRMLTLKEADAIIWDYMQGRNWDALVADSLT